MKKGKHLGEFSFKAITYHVLPKGRIEVNIEGSATGFPSIIGTMRVDGASKEQSGKYDYDWITITDKGETISGSAEDGTWKVLGNHRWETTGVFRFPDGSVIFAEGEIDQPQRSWIGKIYEAKE